MTLRLLTFLFLILADTADAAEPERYPVARVTGWSVDLHWRDPEATGRAWQRLSGYVETRAECEAVKARLVAKIKGGRLQCAYTDDLVAVRP